MVPSANGAEQQHMHPTIQCTLKQSAACRHLTWESIYPLNVAVAVATSAPSAPPCSLLPASPRALEAQQAAVLHPAIHLALAAQVAAVALPALQRLVLAGAGGVATSLVRSCCTLQRFHRNAPACTIQ
jgi:hypothetical protein